MFTTYWWLFPLLNPYILLAVKKRGDKVWIKIWWFKSLNKYFENIYFSACRAKVSRSREHVFNRSQGWKRKRSHIGLKCFLWLIYIYIHLWKFTPYACMLNSLAKLFLTRNCNFIQSIIFPFLHQRKWTVRYRSHISTCSRQNKILCVCMYVKVENRFAKFHGKNGWDTR